MDEHAALLALDAMCLEHRLGESCAIKTNITPEATGIHHLDERRVLRHHHARGNAERSAVIGYCLRVIPRARCNHTSRALIRREIEQPVERTTILEGSGALLVLEFEVQRAGQAAPQREGRHRGSCNNRMRYALACRSNFSETRQPGDSFRLHLRCTRKLPLAAAYRRLMRTRHTSGPSST